MSYPTFHIACHKISTYVAWSQARSKGIGANIIASVRWSASFAIDWQVNRLFVLQPAAPGGAERNNLVSGTANNQSGAIFFEKYLETWKSNYVSARDLGIATAAPAPTRLRSYAQALNGNGTNARST